MRRRECIVINMRSALALIMIFILSGIRSESKSEAELKNKSTTNNSSNNNNNSNNSGGSGGYNSNSNNIVSGHSNSNTVNTNTNTNGNEAIPLTIKTVNETNTIFCSGVGEELQCSELSFPCIRCNYNYSCLYGRDLNVSCGVLEHVQCRGERSFVRTMNCRYCYQTEMWQQSCVLRGNCNSVNDQYYRTNCTANQDVLCLGNRSFTRNVKCNWTQGYRWSTALFISLTLGGFGADRFYLGHWQEGIGKLFSFGGLGVWTIIDVLLISLHYLGPADGSLYI